MYAVIDTETTGPSPRYRHRVVELAVVLADDQGRIEDRWSTLLNPERDLGPQHIHGIRAAQVLNAPQFGEVAYHLTAMLRGRVLVAHNLPFDLMFLRSEFERLGAPFPITRDLGLCTMTLAARFLPGAGRSLRECCGAARIPLEGWHSALADATATAGLLAHYVSAAGSPPPWASAVTGSFSALWPPFTPRAFDTCRREVHVAVSKRSGGGLVAELADYMPRVDESELADPYLAVLDQALADRYLSEDEDAALAALAVSLGLADADVMRLHHGYLDALARVALADRHLSDDELTDLERVAEILGLPPDAASKALDRARSPAGLDVTKGGLPLDPGDLIVFTGDMQEPREVWMQRAADHGYVAHPSVTKKVRLVVAADPDSLSGKAKKARGYNIPIIGIDEFSRALGYNTPDDDQRQSWPNWSQDERAWAEVLRQGEGDNRDRRRA